MFCRQDTGCNTIWLCLHVSLLLMAPDVVHLCLCKFYLFIIGLYITYGSDKIDLLRILYIVAYFNFFFLVFLSCMGHLCFSNQSPEATLLLTRPTQLKCTPSGASPCLHCWPVTAVIFQTLHHPWTETEPGMKEHTRPGYLKGWWGMIPEVQACFATC